MILRSRTSRACPPWRVRVHSPAPPIAHNRRASETRRQRGSDTSPLEMPRRSATINSPCHEEENDPARAPQRATLTPSRRGGSSRQLLALTEVLLASPAMRPILLRMLGEKKRGDRTLQEASNEMARRIIQRSIKEGCFSLIQKTPPPAHSKKTTTIKEECCRASGAASSPSCCAASPAPGPPATACPEGR